MYVSWTSGFGWGGGMLTSLWTCSRHVCFVNFGFAWAIYIYTYIYKYIHTYIHTHTQYSTMKITFRYIYIYASLPPEIHFWSCLQWVWACVFTNFGVFLDLDKDVVGLIHEPDVESKQVLQDIANQYKQNRHFTVKSNVLGLDNEK